jgi:hypothetical protein
VKANPDGLGCDGGGVHATRVVILNGIGAKEV